MSELVYEPLYRIQTIPTRCEEELIRSRPFRRLKYLRHYGVTAFVSPVVHSRYEHSLGVWALTAHFFPENERLRIAALLHDLGHLPFSHAVERTLGFNHHEQTERIIRGESISAILRKHSISPQSVIALLNENTPVSTKERRMSLDHLDSFLRDTESAGVCPVDTGTILNRLKVYKNGLMTDRETAVDLTKTILLDHGIFLKPEHLALDRLLASAIEEYANDHTLDWERLPFFTDDELLAVLSQSSSKKVKEKLNILMYEQERLQPCEKAEAEFTVSVAKVYDDLLYIEDGTDEVCVALLATLQELKREYYFSCRKNV